ncbi:MAG: MFS transporter [Verrucomicrobiae bacterium]|nr:MFS transporter [Verrucomicrobiae bacterium]
MPRRYILVFGTFLLSVLLYVDRACISAAKDSIAGDLSLSDTQMGWVLSIFALGYALFQTPSGMLADRFGPRRILTSVVTLWSVFTALTGAATGFVSMLIYRFLFGTGEAGAFPGIARATFSWIPVRERALITGINFSGSRIGAALAMPAVAWMIVTLGWRSMFYVLGGIGLAWAVFWWFWFRDDPTQSRTIKKDELDDILENRQKVSKEESSVQLTLAQMFRSRNMWFAMIQYFCSNFTFFFCLTWLFPYLKGTYSLTTVDAGFYTSAPLFAGAVGNWFSGWLGDFIYRKGNWPLSRRAPAILGFALAAVGLIASLYMKDVNTAILFFSIAIFGADMTLSPSWSFCIDIGRQSAGAVSGTMNMAGNIGSFITSLAFPYLAAWTGSYTPFFFVGAGLNVVAVVLWLLMKPENHIR